MSTPDRNYRSFSDVAGVTIPEYSRFDPTIEGLRAEDFDDVLKFSNAQRIYGRSLFVRGGRENAIDMNRRCSDITLHDLQLIGGRQAAIVIKGGTKRITLSNVTYEVDPKAWCDVLIGDWSDQSTDLTTEIVLEDHRRLDGKPVRVVVGRGTWPKVIGGNVKICYVKSYALKAYWWLKLAAVRVGIVK